MKNKNKYILPDDIEEGKNLNISLVASFFAVIMLTFIELINDAIRYLFPSYPVYIGRFIVLIVLAMFIYEIGKGHEHLLKIEAYLKSLKKKK